MGGSILLLAQIDDAPGELLSDVLEQMTKMGAKNVQLLASLGKKGRPSYVLLVDVDPEAEADFAAVLAGELGIWGYRVLESRHEHFDIQRHDIEVEVHFCDRSRRFPLRVKRIFSNGTFVRVKAEHDDLKTICDVLELNGQKEYLTVLKARVESEIGRDVPPDVVEIWLDSE